MKLTHQGVDEFAAKYATNLSDGGMFIRTREPKPRGTELSFKVELADGQRVLQGIAVVRWTRADGDPNGPPGMGLEFLELDPASRALVDRMLGKGAPPPPAVVPSPGIAPAQPEGFDALGQSAHPENEIDVPFDSLVAHTPTPPPGQLFESSGPSLSIDIEVELPPEPVPVLEEEPAAPAPGQRAHAGPVFLKDIVPSDGTGPVIGIDLGTTNSACAVLTKGRPVMLTSKDGYNTIPSVVGLSKDGRLQVGHRARAQMVLHPTQFVFGAKRLVGREFDSPTVRQVKDRAHFEIVAGADRRAAVKLGSDVIALDEIQGLVLRECKQMAEQALGVPVSRAVITCPAYYSEPQREAVRRAGAMAGMKRVLKPGGLLIVAEPQNLSSALLLGKTRFHAPVEELVTQAQFLIRCERGKEALGEGNNSIGELVPGMFARLGLQNISVYQSDNASPLLAPYGTPAQRAQKEQLLEWAGRDFWGWDREDAHRFFIAGGGTEPQFEADWAVLREAALQVAAAVREGTEEIIGTGVFFLIAGRK